MPSSDILNRVVGGGPTIQKNRGGRVIYAIRRGPDDWKDIVGILSQATSSEDFFR